MHLNTLLIVIIPLFSIVMAVPIGDSSPSSSELVTFSPQAEEDFRAFGLVFKTKEEEMEARSYFIRWSSNPLEMMGAKSGKIMRIKPFDVSVIVYNQRDEQMRQPPGLSIEIFRSDGMYHWSMEDTFMPSILEPLLKQSPAARLSELSKIVTFSPEAEVDFRALELDGTEEEIMEARSFFIEMSSGPVEAMNAKSGEIMRIQPFDISMYIYDQKSERIRQPKDFPIKIFKGDGMYHWSMEDSPTVPPILEPVLKRSRAQRLKNKKRKTREATKVKLRS